MAHGGARVCRPGTLSPWQWPVPRSFPNAVASSPVPLGQRPCTTQSVSLPTKYYTIISILDSVVVTVSACSICSLPCSRNSTCREGTRRPTATLHSDASTCAVFLVKEGFIISRCARGTLHATVVTVTTVAPSVWNAKGRPHVSNDWRKSGKTPTSNRFLHPQASGYELTVHCTYRSANFLASDPPRQYSRSFELARPPVITGNRCS